MAKAKLTLPNGTNIQIEGTPDEVKGLLETYFKGGTANKTSSKSRKTKSKVSKNSAQKSGPISLIRGLIEENYFKAQKRSISDIQKKLEEGGHIYAQISLSTPLVRLTRSKELRRISDKKGWMYVV